MCARLRALGPAPAQLPADWPHRAHSHGVDAGGVRWHVQWLRAQQAAQSTVLLLHGSGASGHSLAELAALLSAHHDVLVPDLPGHAYTGRPAGGDLSLPGMARALGALLKQLGLRPDWIIGHSAGAAVAARLCLDGLADPKAIVSINGAWFPPGGVDRWWYAPAAKLLSMNPLVPHLFAWQASRAPTLKKLIDSTGSRLDASAVARYGHLVASPEHVGGVLAMMAAWDLKPLLADLPRLRPQLHLLVGGLDGTVPPAQAAELHARLPHSQLHSLPGLGHLAHEEDAPGVATLLQRLRPWVSSGEMPPSSPD